MAPLIEFLSYVPDVRAFIPKMVVNSEISFQISMDLIKNYNIQLRNQQIQMQQYQSKTFNNTNDDSSTTKGINIKIVNNNYTNYIYNNNANSNGVNCNNNNASSQGNEDNIQQAKPNNKRNKNRNSCSGTNLHITNSSTTKHIKSNSTQDNQNNIQSSHTTHSRKKDSKKNMIRLSTAKDTTTNNHIKSNIPIPSHKKNNMKQINTTTNNHKRKGDVITSTNTTTNGCIDNYSSNDSNQINFQFHTRQRSFNKERSKSKAKYNITKSSVKHSRSNSSNQSKAIGFNHETFNSVDKIAFPYDSNNKKSNKSSHKKIKRTKSSGKLMNIPCNYPSFRNKNNDNINNYSTNVSTFRPTTCKLKHIDMKKQYDSDMNPLMSQDLLYY